MELLFLQRNGSKSESMGGVLASLGFVTWTQTSLMCQELRRGHSTLLPRLTHAFTYFLFLRPAFSDLGPGNSIITRNVRASGMNV